MSSLAEELTASVDAVAALGSTSADIDALSDPDALAGQKQIADARRLLDTFAAWMAATLARRSRPELGNAGLAAKQGFLGPDGRIPHRYYRHTRHTRQQRLRHKRHGRTGASTIRHNLT